MEHRKPKAQLIRWWSFCQVQENQMLFSAKSKSTFVRGCHFIHCSFHPQLDFISLWIPFLHIYLNNSPTIPQQKPASEGTKSLKCWVKVGTSSLPHSVETEVADRALTNLNFEFPGFCLFKPNPSNYLHVSFPSISLG